MKKIFFIFVVLIFITQSVFSNYLENIELFKISARASAAGNLLTFQDVSNPAATSTLDKNCLSLSYSSLFQNLISNMGVIFVYKVPKTTAIFSKTKIDTLGINIFYNKVDTEDTSGLSFYDQNQNGIKDPNEEIIYEEEKILVKNNSNLMVNFAFSRQVNKNLNIAGVVKYFTSNFEQVTANAISLDLAMIYNTQKIKGLSLGLKLKNLINTNINWSTGTKEEIPLRVELGVGYKKLISSDFNLYLGSDIGNAYENYYSLGTELSYKDKYFLRGSLSKLYINSSNPTDFVCIGFGIKLKERINVDYSIKFSQVEENIHFASLSYTF